MGTVSLAILAETAPHDPGGNTPGTVPHEPEMHLREIEKTKIACAKKFFVVLGEKKTNMT